jgi:hypothetical protein
LSNPYLGKTHAESKCIVKVGRKKGDRFIFRKISKVHIFAAYRPFRGATQASDSRNVDL